MLAASSPTKKSQKSDSPKYPSSKTSLSYIDDQFYLKNITTNKYEKIRLISGAIHYFRMPQEYWRDRILKLKATGANVVETYMAWNLHEHKPNLWNFADNLDINKFVRLCGELDMLVILRPGPYICSEFDFGGLPAWLLHDPNMQVRSNYPKYLKFVNNYFTKIFQQVLSNQFRSSEFQGPIIAVQIENEFGAYIKRGPDYVSNEHVVQLKNMLLNLGVPELLFTADGAYDLKDGSVAGELATVNFGYIGNEFSPYDKLERLQAFQPDKPLMVMEFWTGWFDHWAREHHHRDDNNYNSNLESILNFTNKTNVNLYMFFGGTNFGFMNGANSEREKIDKLEPKKSTFEYLSDTTSYDYDAPLSENGNFTEKFFMTKNLVQKYVYDPLNLTIPSFEELGVKEPTSTSYPGLEILCQGHLPMWEFIRYLDPENVVEVYEPIASEYLPIHPSNGDFYTTGQSHGYTLYTSSVKISNPNHKNMLSLEGFKNNIRDRGQIFIENKRIGFIDANTYRDSIAGPVYSNSESVDIQILTENAGRINYGYFLNEQRKGLLGRITSRGEPVINWKIYPLEFDLVFLEKVTNRFHPLPNNLDTMLQTGLWKFHLDLSSVSKLEDTFIDMSDFNKGIVFVNNINLGRYWRRGPSLSLYWPAPYQIQGLNEIVIFEEYDLSLSARKIRLSDQQIISFRQAVNFEHVYDGEEGKNGDIL